jgi:hypothetical protein
VSLKMVPSLPFSYPLLDPPRQKVSCLDRNAFFVVNKSRALSSVLPQMLRKFTNNVVPIVKAHGGAASLSTYMSILSSGQIQESL